MCQEFDVTFGAHRASRRNVLRLFGTAAAACAVNHEAVADTPKAPPKPRNVIFPDAALKRLMDGNVRYASGAKPTCAFQAERAALKAGQNPYAAILCCADSRVAPEFAFDTGLGDLFVCRVAGNIVNEDVIASLEYAVAELKTPLIMVLGHSSCGAVAATIKSLKDKVTLPGHLPSLVRAIAPAVEAPGGNVLDTAVRRNVADGVVRLLHTPPILSTSEDSGKIKIVGGVYSLASGRVELVA